MWYDNTIYCDNCVLGGICMSVGNKRYKKAAKAKAKEYLRNKRGYKTREEKKAFRLAEKFRIKQWRTELDKLDAQERREQLGAFRYYNIQRNLLMILVGCGLLAVALIAALIILL